MTHFHIFTSKKTTLLAFALLIAAFTNAQEKYWVFLTDKEGVSFNPHEYFDEKAIARREKLGISLYDESDWPLKEKYIQQIKENVISLSQTSRWFNAVAVYADKDQIEKIATFSFVKTVEMISSEASLCGEKSKDFETELSEEDKNILKEQTMSMGAERFWKADIDGRGIRIAIFDAGFPTVDVNPVFEHIRKNNRIIKTYDFVSNRENVYGHNAHGTMVLSCIAGMVNGERMGLATGAEFLLARTEYAHIEPYSEEENWLAAAEWADKNGADIINSSLGYTYHRYFTEQMDGKYALVTRAANKAASKGILVVNAAGNEGDGDWEIIGAPADADSVLSVGGIAPESGYHTFFSSFGPTSDLRMKPNVCAYGHVIASGKKGLKRTQGTSFSSPLVAGFAACAWQTRRQLKNMELFEEIQKSASLYPYYDYAHGFGIPQAAYFAPGPEKEIAEPSFEFIEEEGVLQVSVKEASGILYFHLANEKGLLKKYSLISVDQEIPLQFIISDYQKGEILRVHYKAFTNSYTF